MDCLTFHQHADAFADGELLGDVRAAATDHAATCPNCARIVDAITDMKSAINRAYPESPAPQGLETRVAAALDEVSGVGMALPWFRRNQVMVPLGIAAAVAAAALWWWPVGGEPPHRGAAVSVPGQTVADVRQQHHICVGEGDSHRALDLPADPAAAAKVLSDELGLAVIVPDLSASGFELLGVGRCGIRGRAGSHALYRSPDSDLNLSVFTVKRLDCLPVRRLTTECGRKYFFEYKERLAVLAWHGDRQTYVVCAPLPQPAMLAVVEQIRVARGAATGERLALRSRE